MCGIIGYIGKKPAQNVILEGLRRLEYRGYDSAGLCILNSRGASNSARRVAASTISPPSSPSSPAKGDTGIGHTRWATRWTANRCLMPHPHLDQSRKLALVHNGVIEEPPASQGTASRQGPPVHLARPIPKCSRTWFGEHYEKVHADNPGRQQVPRSRKPFASP